MSPDIHVLTGAYAADALPPDEQAVFEEHLAVCAACRDEVAELRATTARLAAAASEEPPPAMKASVMERIRDVRQEPPVPATPDTASLGTDRDGEMGGTDRTVRDDDLADRRRTRPRPWANRVMAAAAALLAVATVGLGTWALTLQQQVDEAQETNERMADVLTAPDVDVVSTEGPGGSFALVALSPSRGEGVLVARGLPQVGDEQTYELWLIDDTGPTPAGLFAPDDDGEVTRQLAGRLDGLQAVGITVEPAGGSPQPTSDPVMVFPVGQDT